MYPYYSKLDNQYPTGPYGVPMSTYGLHHNVVPRYPSNYRKQRSIGSCCLKCCYCCCCFMIILTITIVLLVISLVNIYDPKIPEYRIETLDVKSFHLLPDSNLNIEIMVNLRVDNPNTKIKFNYGEDSSIQVLYLNHDLCESALPPFQQVHENSTLLNLWLKGKTDFGPEMQKELEKSRRAHLIPVDVNVKVPISIIVGEVVTLGKFNICIDCHMTLDNLSANDTIGILSKDMRFRFEL